MTEDTTKRPRRMAREPKPEASGAEAPDAGIGGEPAAAPTPMPEKPQTKAALVLDLLRREQGATLDEMVEATGWLPHTTRAALTGLKKKGHVIERSKRDDVTCYRIAVAG